MATGGAKAPSSGSQPALPPARTTPRGAALVFAAVAGAVALLALVGWLGAGVELAGGVAGYQPMAPSTAIGVLLLGLALASRLREPRGRTATFLTAAVPALVGAFAAGALVGFLTGTDLGLDRLLAPRSAAPAGAPSGWVSPVTSALFLLLSAAWLLDLAGATRRLRRDAALVVAGVTLAVATALTIGYAFGAPFFYSAGIVPVAFPTAVSFLLLALALLATRDRRLWIDTAGVAAVLVVVVGVAVSGASAAVVASFERGRARAAVAMRTAAVETAIERSMVENFDEVERVAAFLAADPAVDLRGFRWCVAPRFASHPGILALGWTPRLTDGEAPSSVSAALATLGEPRSLHAPGGGPRPAGTVLMPLRYVEGPVVSPTLVGFDLASLPTVRDALERAATSGDLVASTEVSPTAPGLGEPAVWVVMAVGSPTSGGAVVRGFAVGAYSLSRIVVATLAGFDEPETIVKVTASAAGADASRLRQFRLAGRTFSIAVTPRPSAAGDERAWIAGSALGGGLLVTMLLALYLVRGARHGVETRHLLEAVRASERRANETLSLLEQTVSAIPVPVFLKGRDGAYQMCNPEMGRWLGQDASGLIGKLSEELYPAGEAQQLRAMDHGLFAHPGAQTLRTTLPGPGGEAREVVVTKASVLDGRGAVRGVVGVMFDVTEQRRAATLQTALLELSEATYAASGLDELLPAVHHVVGRLMVVRNFYVALLDPATGLLTFPYLVDEEDAAPPAPRPPGRGLTEFVLRTGRPELVSHQRFTELAAAGEVELIGAPSLDWLGVPLVIGGAPRGVLAVQTYTQGERYDERDRDLLTVVAHSISEAIERTQATAALRESEERFRSLFENMFEGFAFCRMLWENGAPSDFIYLQVNSRFEALTGLRDVIGKPVSEVIPGIRESNPELLEAYGRVAATGNAERFETFVPELGIWLSISVYSPVKDHFIAVFDNITERKRAQEELVQAQRMEAVGRLAGGVAHDLNNAMQSMLTTIALVRARGADPATLEASLATLDEEVRRAATTTRQLLLFSHREVTRLEPLDLGELVRESEPLLRPLLRGGARLRIEAQGAPLLVRADRGQLQQALMNLVAHASDAMPDGGTVRLVAGAEGAATVYLEVYDTGAGMSDEVRAHLFEPFFTTKGAERGTGLGLSVTQGIVARHGGHLEVESAAGVGSRFRAAFPRHAEGPPPAPPHAEGLGRGRRILLVEDEDGAREGLAAVLDMMGFVVTAVGSGEAALGLPRDPPFDLLLTDIVLPGIGGGEIARRLSAQWPAMKVVLMSGHAEDVLARQQVRLGEVRFLQKPFAMDALAHELAAALAAAPGAQPRAEP